MKIRKATATVAISGEEEPALKKLKIYGDGRFTTTINNKKRKEKIFDLFEEEDDLNQESQLFVKFVNYIFFL